MAGFEEGARHGLGDAVGVDGSAAKVVLARRLCGGLAQAFGRQ